MPASGAVKDGIVQLEGMARFKLGSRQPAIREGGDHKVIWIDLGGAEWRAVRVTAEGWDIVSGPDVAFERGGTMQALPEPTRGGNIQMLRGVLNVQPGEFVLVAGWLLQVWNPSGSYPVIDVCGESEFGKTTTSKLMCIS